MAHTPGADFSRRKRVGSGWAEVLVKGVRQGASRDKRDAKDICSDLCRANLQSRAAALVGDAADEEAAEAKQRFLRSAEFQAWVGNHRRRAAPAAPSAVV